MAMGGGDLSIIRWRGKGCKRNPVVSKELGEGGNEGATGGGTLKGVIEGPARGEESWRE